MNVCRLTVRSSASSGLQGHDFLRQPDGEQVLLPLQSVGAPDGTPVPVNSDGTCFEPLWSAWGPAEAR